MIAPNICLDEFYHIIKKMHFGVKTGDPHVWACPPATPKTHMHADRPFLSRNAILTLCGLISHQNKENKKKLLKSLDK